ncbi:MAG TPA: nicotinate (nicotinamide) nucleotide adenylyltransferase [Flavisolibacter sp.]|nr:nicotinate (nicotinamide) nucleotide adenylyltransferase [Flavisolibacter sp.]
MKVGLYFGSFNPIHVGHLIIANHILNETNLDKIWFVISPQNPFKPSASLLNEYDRLFLVQRAIGENARMKASDIEFALPKPSFTVHTLAYLEEKFPEYSFHIIMGSDSFQNLPKWKNSETIMTRYPIIIYKRPGFEVVNSSSANITVMNAPLLEISATHIRELVAAGKSIKYLVPDPVAHEIESSRFYKKNQNK